MLRSPKEDSEGWKKYVEKKRKLETDTRSGDPFYISDKFNPNYQRLVEEKRLKEGEAQKSRLLALISTEGKTPEQIKDEVWAACQKYERVKKQAEEVEISFIPTLHPGMEKQFGKSPEQLPRKRSKQSPSSNGSP